MSMYDIFGGHFDMEVMSESFREDRSDQIMDECFIAQTVASMGDEAIAEFCTPGGVGEQLVNEGKISRKTLVRLNKADDLTRRKSVAALIAAKEANDPLYAKYIKYAGLKSEFKEKILQKYDTRALRIARKKQQEFLHSKKPALAKMFDKLRGNTAADQDDK